MILIEVRYNKLNIFIDRNYKIKKCWNKDKRENK